MEGVEESSGRRCQQPPSISVRKRASPCTSSAQSLQSSHTHSTPPPPRPPRPPRPPLNPRPPDDAPETLAAGPEHRAGSRRSEAIYHHARPAKRLTHSRTAAYVCHVDRIGLYRLRHVDRIELYGHEHGRRWHAPHHIAPGPS